MTIAIVIAVALIAGSVIFLLVRWGQARRANQEEEWRREASSRGWAFRAESARGVYNLEWKGTTDFVSWTAEYVEFRRRQGRSTSPMTTVRRSRWSTDTLRGPSQPIVLMGVPQGQEATALFQGDGMLAELARKAAVMGFEHVLDSLFGKEAGNLVDAATLNPVNVTLPGFIVRAGDPAEASRVLAAGLQQAMAAAVRDSQSAFSDDAHRPWVLLLPRQVLVAHAKALRATAEVERLARAGVQVVKAPHHS